MVTYCGQLIDIGRWGWKGPKGWQQTGNFPSKYQDVGDDIGIWIGYHGTYWIDRNCGQFSSGVPDWHLICENCLRKQGYLW